MATTAHKIIQKNWLWIGDPKPHTDPRFVFIELRGQKQSPTWLPHQECGISTPLFSLTIPCCPVNSSLVWEVTPAGRIAQVDESCRHNFLTHSSSTPCSRQHLNTLAMTSFGSALFKLRQLSMLLQGNTQEESMLMSHTSLQPSRQPAPKSTQAKNRCYSLSAIIHSPVHISM